MTQAYRLQYRLQNDTASRARRIQARRERLGLTRQELATAAGKDTATVWSIETGKTVSPQRSTLDLLERALDEAEEARAKGLLEKGVSVITDYKAETKRLDAEALEICRSIVTELRKMLPEAQIEDAGESMYASSRYDAGSGTVVRMPGRELIDVRVEINSSEEYEDEMQGWSFGLASTWEGGRIGPGGTLYNYSDRVWTLDREEIARRIEWLKQEASQFAWLVAEAVKEGNA